jgi:hypothetical protein
MSISATEAIRRFAALDRPIAGKKTAAAMPGRPRSAFIEDWHVCRRRGRYLVEHTRGTRRATSSIDRFAREEASAGRTGGQLSLFDQPERTSPSQTGP